MATITIDVHNSSLALRGSGPLTSAFDVTFDEPLSMCGVFSFRVPGSDPDMTMITTQDTVVKIYADGSLVYVGLVEAMERAISGGGVVWTISGRSYLAALTDQTVGFLALVSGAAGVTDGPSDVLSETSPTGLSSGWTLDTTNGASATSTAVYARFRGESRLAALVKIAEKIREGFIYRPQLAGSGDKKVIWLTGYTSSGVRAIQGGGEAVALEGNPYICLIESLTELEDGAELANRIVVYGAGDDLENSALTIAASTYGSVGTVGQPDWFAIYPTSGDGVIDYRYSQTTLGYRYREAVVQFPDIAPISNTDADQQSAANMLAYAAMQWLRRYGIPHKFYELEVLKLPSTVYAGKTIRVIYYEQTEDGTVLHDINADLNVINVSTQYGNDGSVRYRLTVSTTDRFPTSEGEMVAARIEKANVYGAYTQLGPSVDTICHTEDFDDTTGASINFWLGTEIAQVQQVLLRFKVSALRSTVQSIAGSSTTTPSGGGSTTESGGGSVSGSGDHVHPINIPPGTVATNIGLDAGGGIVNAGGGTATPSTQFETGGHTHTTPNHIHDTPAHQHTFVPNISSSYGIFQDSGNVIDVSDVDAVKAGIVLTVNGTVRTGSIEASSASGWYELDVTGWVSSATTFRPTQMASEIVIKAAISGKMGRVTAQLQIRALVQSVAYS